MKKATCIESPRGRGKLEGFVKGEIYNFAVTSYAVRNHYRVYLKPDYYETCSGSAFRQYFKVMED